MVLRLPDQAHHGVVLNVTPDPCHLHVSEADPCALRILRSVVCARLASRSVVRSDSSSRTRAQPSSVNPKERKGGLALKLGSRDRYETRPASASRVSILSIDSTANGVPAASSIASTASSQPDTRARLAIEIRMSSAGLSMSEFYPERDRTNALSADSAFGSRAGAAGASSGSQVYPETGWAVTFLSVEEVSPTEGPGPRLASKHSTASGRPPDKVHRLTSLRGDDGEQDDDGGDHGHEP
jgi:hypothetical protein